MMMPKNRNNLYIGAAVAGVGAYYFYRAGGNPKAAKEELKHDTKKAQDKLPNTEQAERAGEKAGLETNLNIDEAAQNARSKANSMTSEGIKKVEEQTSKMRSEVEQKAAEAKESLPGWLGGGKK